MKEKLNFENCWLIMYGYERKIKCNLIDVCKL